MAKQNFLICCAPNDFYLGEPLSRHISGEDIATSLLILDNNQNTDVKPDDFNHFIFITNQETINEGIFKDLIERTLCKSDSKVFFLQNEKNIEYDFPQGKAFLLDVEGGLDQNDINYLSNPNENSVRVGIVIDFDERAQIAKEKEIKFERAIGIIDISELFIEGRTQSTSVQRGMRYLLGDGVPQDFARALSIFRKAVQDDSNDTLAKYYLALCHICFESDLSEEEAKKEAILLLEDAITNGLLEAKRILAFIYIEEGSSDEKAKEIYTEMAKDGEPEGGFMLGFIAEQSGNYNEAFETYLEVAETGFAKAQNAVGCLYADGLGCKQDLEKAKQWFELAKNQGLPHAMTNLGLILIGNGDKTQYQQALDLLRDGAAKGIKSACNAMEQIEEEMVRQQKVEREKAKKAQEEQEASELLKSLFNGIKETASYAGNTLFETKGNGILGR